MKITNKLYKPYLNGQYGYYFQNILSFIQGDI